jgi:hypothetical protein
MYSNMKLAILLSKTLIYTYQRGWPFAHASSRRLTPWAMTDPMLLYGWSRIDSWSQRCITLGPEPLRLPTTSSDSCRNGRWLEEASSATLWGCKSWVAFYDTSLVDECSHKHLVCMVRTGIWWPWPIWRGLAAMTFPILMIKCRNWKPWIPSHCQSDIPEQQWIGQYPPVNRNKFRIVVIVSVLSVGVWFWEFVRASMFSPIWTGNPVAFIPICTLMLEGRTFGKHFGIIYNL